jgi:hypothetical protein
MAVQQSKKATEYLVEINVLYVKFAAHKESEGRER